MKILFFDIEVTAQKKITNIGAIDQHGNIIYSGKDVETFYNKAKKYDILAGHNVLHHDLKYLLEIRDFNKPIIDTLWLSSLIFIRKPYHKLIKEYKGGNIDPEYEDELDNFFLRHQPGGEEENTIIENNPIKDSQLSIAVFNNCLAEFENIDFKMQQILYELLKDSKQFGAFFNYLIDQKKFTPKKIKLEEEIQGILNYLIEKDFFDLELPKILAEEPICFAYIFRLIEQNLNRDLSINPDCSILPDWINYTLSNNHKVFGKIYKYKKFDAKTELKSWGLQNFREYTNDHGEKIKQEDIVNSGFYGEDFIAVLATGGGKSLCFQLPALAKAEASGFLTLVISPLQSLMEDQVANLKYRYNKTNVGALHSALDPLTKKEVCEKVEHGGIELLYLSPEMLRSPSTQSLLAKRHIDRLVIDEAHCFSKRGHDFRIDYMFIADFIKELGKINSSIKDISISCFTATAKQEVIDEIKTYFKNHFGKELKEYKSTAKRENLHYETYNVENEKKKFDKLIDILENRVDNKACIIFTRYTGQKKAIGAQNLTQDINERLLQDGYGHINAAFFHGQLEGPQKKEMMQKFMSGEVNVIVATNAFGMGVDKTDVRYVIHYDMPSSLENYLQEAGRAGRDGNDSNCIILYTPDDLDQNLQLNQQSQIKKREVQMLLKYIRSQFQQKGKNKILKSAKEFVKYSGRISGDFEEEYTKNKTTWETKVRTALWFLEKPFPKENESWFIERKFNKTRVFATAKGTKFYNTFSDQAEEDMELAFNILENLNTLDDDELRVIKDIYRQVRTGKVISIEDLPNKVGRHIRRIYSAEGTKSKKGIEELVEILREQNLIDKDEEISLSLNITGKQSSEKRLEDIRKFFDSIFDILSNEYGDYINEGSEILFSRKGINTELTNKLGNTSNIDKIDHFLHILKNRGYVNIVGESMIIYKPFSEIKQEINSQLDMSSELIKLLFDETVSKNQREKEWIPVVVNIKILAKKLGKKLNNHITIIQLENILKLLHEFDIIGVESGLFLYFTRFDIEGGKHLKTIAEDGKEKYTNLNEKHFETLADFYKNKTQQAHIMDEFARKIIEYLPINAVEQFVDAYVDDYFNLDYEKEFLPKYFKGRLSEISRSTSKAKHDEIRDVSDEQKEILESKNDLLVIAGPGSGKTKSLVHKVANLVLEEGVSKDEFLLLTFMRSAKYELKNRIIKLIGNQGYALKIHTFHGFAYELLDKNPLKDDYNSEEGDSDNIIKDAITYLNENKDLQLPYRVIMLDEFQDIGKIYFEFIEAISRRSSFEENKIRIIATGDDDQSIMEFNGADIKYIQNFQEAHNADSVILSKNFRSTQDLVNYTTSFIKTIKDRLKKGTELMSGRIMDIFQNPTKIETRNCKGNYLFGIADALESIRSQNKRETTAIICNENETVLQINHILQKKGIKAQILLGDQGYKLRDTLELRYFLDICNDTIGDKLTKDNIRDKYNSVIAIYGENKNTDTLKKIINTIVDTNSFITPKIVEDFIIDFKDEADLIDEEHQLFISTFHKAKGREFDNVIICFDPNKNKGRNHDIDNKNTRNNNTRLIYVGMTRAKNNLILLGNTDNNRYFKFLYEYSSVQKEISYNNEDTDEISVITTLSDIFMSYNNDNIIKDPRIGAEVDYNKDVNSKGEGILNFLWEGSIIQKSSKNLLPKQITKRFNKGYNIAGIKVFQKILHSPKGDDKEHLVFLFDISLKKIPQELKEIEETKSKIENLEHQISILEKEGLSDNKLQEIIKERDNQIALLEEKTSDLEQKLTTAEEKIKQREKNIENNQMTIKKLQNELIKIEEEIEDIEGIITILENNLLIAKKEGNKKIEKEYEEKLFAAQNKLKESEEKLNNTNQEKIVLEERNQELEDENLNLKKENEELSKKINEVKNGESEGNRAHIFKAGDGEALKEYVIKQIRTANRSVVIIDPYIDNTTFELISNRRIGVKGEIRYDSKKTGYSLTGSSISLSELLKNKEDQEGNPIIIRNVNNLHDRFLIIDNIVRQIGTSMNSTMGSKATTIQRLKNTKEEILDAHR